MAMSYIVGAEAKRDFKTTGDLEDFISKMDRQKQNVDSKKPQIEPDKDALKKKQEEFLSESKAKLEKKLRQKTDFIKSKPCFKKPAFYLNQLSPIVKVDIVFFFQKGSRLNSPIEEKRIRLFDETNQNNITSFKYDVSGGDQGKNITLTFVDPRQEITEMLAVQMAALDTYTNSASNPKKVRLEIEYGWYINQDFRPAGIEDWESIMFTNKLYCIFVDMKTKYAGLNLPETTIIGNAENVDSAVFRHATPYDIFGPYPATTLIFEEIYRLFSEAFQNFSNNAQKEISRVNLIIQLGRILYTRGIIDNELIIKIIGLAAKYFSVELTKPVTDDKAKNQRSFVAENVIELIKKIIYQGHHKNFSNDKNFNKKMNLMMEVAHPASNQINKLEKKNNENAAAKNTDDKTTKKLDKLYNKYDKTPVATTLYHINFRSRIDAEITLQAKDRHFTNFFTTAGTAIHNCCKIHPYFLYLYVRNYIYTQLLNVEEADTNYIELWDWEVDLRNNLLPNNYIQKDGSAKQDFRCFKSIGGNATDEIYFVNATDVALTISETWSNIFRTIFSKMYVKYIPPDKKDLNKGLQFELTDTEKKAYSNSVPYIPLPLVSTVFSCDYIAARKNIKIWIQALKARKEFSKDVMKQKSTADTDILLKEAETALGMVSPGEQYLIHLVTVKIDPSSAFNADLGRQRIRQAYSYRVGEIYNQGTMFNPGDPTCWDINFPDVISLDVDHDMLNAARSVATAGRMSGDSTRGSIATKNFNQTLVTQYLEEATQYAQANIKNSATEAQLTKLKEYLTKIQAIDPNCGLSKNSAARIIPNPINVTIAGSKQSRVYSGDFYNMLDKKRGIQNLRAAFMFTGVQVSGTMTALGDPSFTSASSMSAYIFLKVINIDGSLSHFTGTYLTNKISHEIGAGKFTTTFDIQSDAQSSSGDPETIKQLKKVIYESDKQKGHMLE